MSQMDYLQAPVQCQVLSARTASICILRVTLDQFIVLPYRSCNDMKCLDVKYELFGLSIDNVDFNGAINLINSLVELPTEGKGRYIVTPNVDHIVRLRYDKEFQCVYNGAAAIFADGMPLVWASHLLGKPLR